jgi:hypothetical protein
MARRRSRGYRRNPSAAQNPLLWAGAAGIAYWLYSRANKKITTGPVAQYTTPSTSLGDAPVAPTPPAYMVANAQRARQPGYIGIPYGAPTWNGKAWEQAV